MVLAVLSAVCVAAAVAALMSLVALMLRRPQAALRIAQGAFAAAALGSAVLVTVLLLMWLAPRPAGWAAIELLVDSAADPSARARRLADGITTLVGSSLVALPACLLSAILWALARRHTAGANA